MARRTNVLFLTLFLVVIFLMSAAVFGAEKPAIRAKDRVSLAARHAPIYGLGGLEEPIDMPFKAGNYISLGLVPTASPGTQIGTTTYDYQHNCSEGRQVEHRGYNTIHFDWMKQTNDIFGGDRGIGVNAYDLIGCQLMNTSGGWNANVDYAGYVSIDADQGGCAVVAGHENPGTDYRPQVYWDFCTGGPMGLFTADSPSDFYGWYQTNGTGPDNPNIWPIIDYQLGTSTVLHMVCAEFGGDAGDPQTLSYWRRVGGYGAGVGVWSDQRVIDTVMTPNPVIAASTTNDKVAIVWSAPADYKRDTPTEFDNQYENDVWYSLSGNQGADWIAGIGNSVAHDVVMGSQAGANITNYTEHSDYNAYCDNAALISSDNNLHIVWA